MIEEENEENMSEATVWGGNRKGAGRKRTGRSKRGFYITQEEEIMLRGFLEAMREGQQPIKIQTIKEKYEQLYEDAIIKQLKNCGNKPKFVIQFYKMQALGELIGIKTTSQAFLKDLQEANVERIKLQEEEYKKKIKEIKERKLADKGSQLME